MAIQPTTFALVDMTDHSFLNWNLPSWKAAMNFHADYVNKHNIGIVKIHNRVVVTEMSKNANRPTRRQRINLALARTKYPLR
jgi:hypothetical protein